jgi:hypothetical protein
VKNFKKRCSCNAVDESDDGMLENESEEAGDVRKMKALTVKMETVTLSGEGR